MKAHYRLKWGILAALFALSHWGSLSANAQRPLAVDVSSYQGSKDSSGATNINWPTVKTDGLPFVMIKACEATKSPDGYNPDPDYVYNITQAKAQGIIAGSYYFAHPELDTADVAANYFWSISSNYIKADGLSLMPMLDFEQNVTNANPAFTSATLSAWLNTWCQDIVNLGKTNGLKLNPLVYTFTSYATGTAGYGPALDSTVTQWPLWMASYNGANVQTGGPSSTAPWSTWTFWQYTSSANYSGITGVVDADVYNGTLASMISSYVVVPTGPNITAQPTNFVAYAGSNATFTVAATSTAGSISYQWAKNGVNISGATASNYVVTNVQVTNAGASYSVTLTNTNGFTLSSNVFVFVKSLPTNGVASIIVTNLVNWWPGDGNLNDLIGNATAKPLTNMIFTNGEVGSAMQFDGTNLVLSTGLADLALPWTVSVWVNRQNTPQTSAGILENGTNSLKLEQYKNTHNVGLSILGVADLVFGSGYSAPVSTWTHLAFVGTNTGVSLYANGNLIGTLTNTFALPRAYIGGGFYIGSGQYLDQLRGNLDELMIFNKALSPAQISTIYSARTNGVVKAPQIVGIRPNNSQVLVGVRGLIGKNYSLYSSTDLQTWSLLGALVNSQGTNQFTDTVNTNAPAYYYRVSQSY